MRRALSIVFAALLLGVGLRPGLGATATIPLRLEQLSQEAEIIVLGTVIDQVSAWDTAHTAIHTNVTVKVEEAMKGVVGPEVAFWIAGGEVGPIGMRTSADPMFRVGERVIIFLHTAGSTARLVGLKQGKFTVSNDVVTQQGQAVAISDFKTAIRATTR